jgi:hypothetical protein
MTPILADAGTPLMWAGFAHLTIGNLLIGLLEAGDLRKERNRGSSVDIGEPQRREYRCGGVGCARFNCAACNGCVLRVMGRRKPLATITRGGSSAPTPLQGTPPLRLSGATSTRRALQHGPGIAHSRPAITSPGTLRPHAVFSTHSMHFGADRSTSRWRRNHRREFQGRRLKAHQRRRPSIPGIRCRWRGATIG